MQVAASRIDHAIAPAGFVSSGVVYSLFIADDGLYLIRTGNGWRMSFRGLARNERMAAEARRTEAAINPSNLAAELAAREGSLFIAGAELTNIELGTRLDGFPDLRFESGASKFRVQFDAAQRAEVEAFVASLLAAFSSDSVGAQRTMLSFEGTAIETVGLPSPCWGARPYVAVADQQLFVEYIAPTGHHHGEMSVVYRCAGDEQAQYALGELDLGELCQRLVRAAWGSTPPTTTDG